MGRSAPEDTKYAPVRIPQLPLTRAKGAYAGSLPDEPMLISKGFICVLYAAELPATIQANFLNGSNAWTYSFQSSGDTVPIDPRVFGSVELVSGGPVSYIFLRRDLAPLFHVALETIANVTGLGGTPIFVPSHAGSENVPAGESYSTEAVPSGFKWQVLRVFLGGTSGQPFQVGIVGPPAEIVEYIGNAVFPTSGQYFIGPESASQGTLYGFPTLLQGDVFEVYNPSSVDALEFIATLLQTPI